MPGPSFLWTDFRPLIPIMWRAFTDAQIGLVCLGIHLLDMTEDQGRIAGLALTEAQMEFLEPVNPGELVRVTGQRVYFRFGKLKCNVCLYRENGLLACRGTISGMLNKEQV